MQIRQYGHAGGDADEKQQEKAHMLDLEFSEP